MLRILLGSGLLFMVCLIGVSNGQVFRRQGYSNDIPSNPLAYDLPEKPSQQFQGYPKETPTKQLTYPTSRPTTTPKPQGYPKETPSVPLTYPTTRRTTTYTTPRPTTPRPTTTTTTTPRPTTARLITTPKPQGYPKETPSVRLTYPTTRRTTTYTTPRPTTPRPTTTTTRTTPRPTTARLITTPKPQGYPKETPSVRLTYPTTVPTTTTRKVEGYPKVIPANPLLYQSPVESRGSLFGASSNQNVFKAHLDDARPNQLNGAPSAGGNRFVPSGEDNDDDGHYRHDSDHGHWDIRKSVPGEPEVDYPVLDSVPNTRFTCEDRMPGYYADMETRCQTFHVCSTDPAGMQKTSFLCPNGSVFNQELFTCDWWVNVNCAASEKYYSLNSEIGQLRPVSKGKGTSLFSH